MFSKKAFAAPTFLYAGPAKCGSSWLAKVLSEHPDVFVPPAKDIMYFDRHYDWSSEWYFSFFPKGPHSQAGEVCHNYFEFPLAARRIRDRLPNVKLIFILRDRVDRTVSQWIYEQSVGRDLRTPFEDFARRADIAAINDYVANLTRYFDLFSREQIKVLFFDDLARDPAQLARDVFDFLNVDNNFAPPSVNKRVLPASRPRFGAASVVAYHAAQAIRVLGGANFVGWVKRSDIFNRVMFRSDAPRPAPPAEVLQVLWEEFSRDNEALSRLLGRSLPPHWYTSPHARAITKRG